MVATLLHAVSVTLRNLTRARRLIRRLIVSLSVMHNTVRGNASAVPTVTTMRRV